VGNWVSVWNPGYLHINIGKRHTEGSKIDLGRKDGGFIVSSRPSLFPLLLILLLSSIFTLHFFSTFLYFPDLLCMLVIHLHFPESLLEGPYLHVHLRVIKKNKVSKMTFPAFWVWKRVTRASLAEDLFL
jgi:hypothetical protein